MTLATNYVKTEFHRVMQGPFADGLGIQSLDSYPSMEVLARSMFGDAWCDLVLYDVPRWKIPTLVSTSRPAFLPGLLPAQVEVEAIDLPEMDLEQLQ